MIWFAQNTSDDERDAVRQILDGEYPTEGLAALLRLGHDHNTAVHASCAPAHESRRSIKTRYNHFNGLGLEGSSND